MAIRKAAEMVGRLTSKDRLPRNRYAIRCVSEEFKPSSKGNPMIEREWEIVAPESVTISGKEVEIAGQTGIMQYCTILVQEDGKRDDSKSDAALDRFLTERRNLGLPADEIDDENPPLDMEGKVVDAILSSDEYVSRLDPTPEQLAKGQKYGDPIKDAEGHEVKNYRIRLEQILGPSSVQVNRPF